MLVRTMQGDTVDSLCWRHYGQVTGLAERVFELNPGLAELGAVLPSGIEVKLPPRPVQMSTKKTVKLWG